MDEVSPIVSVKQGTLRGTYNKNLQGGTFSSFKGIPYAEPPLGELRFKAPKLPLPWTGTRDASKEGNNCYAKDSLKNVYLGSEDCLYLNVYTPSLPSESDNVLKPVMFWIHGGGLIRGSGSSDLYGPEFLITGDVVLVTINYRLGVLGFLSLEDASLGVPGNAGFKDMVMALKWVQHNISKFNGDPDNVTIFGQSSGAYAVHLLTLSPMTKHLYHKAIAQSGCALNPGAKGRQFVEELCYVLQYRETAEHKVLTFLQNLSVNELIRAQDKMPYFLDPNKIGPFGFIVERKGVEPAFMEREPIEVLWLQDYAKVPFMIGYTKDEGMMIKTYKLTRYMNMANNFECNVPYILGYEEGSEESRTLASKIKQFYFGNEKPCCETRRKFYNMVTDTLFLYGMYATVKKQGKSGIPIHFYRVSLDTEHRFHKQVGKESEIGAAHCDDLLYLFKTSGTPPIINPSKKYQTTLKFVKLWTNFAHYGNPTPRADEDEILENIEWLPANGDDFYYLDIGEHLSLETNPEEKRINFWKDVYSHTCYG